MKIDLFFDKNLSRYIEEAQFVVDHYGRCKGNICSECFFTKIKGNSKNCNNDTALETATEFLNNYME